jgi:putative transposase
MQRSSGWRKACRLAAKLHRHVLNQRNDFQHQGAGELVNHYGLIVEEDLNVQGLAGGRLAKSVPDAAWSSFIVKLLDKAESADGVLVKADPRGTSQQCPCGKPAPKKLGHRLQKCSRGLNTTRDHASALEILRRGLRLRTETPALAGVALKAPSLSYGA